MRSAPSARRPARPSARHLDGTLGGLSVSLGPPNWGEASLRAYQPSPQWGDASFRVYRPPPLWGEASLRAYRPPPRWGEASLRAYQPSPQWGDASLRAYQPSPQWGDASFCAYRPPPQWGEASLRAYRPPPLRGDASPHATGPPDARGGPLVHVSDPDRRRARAAHRGGPSRVARTGGLYVERHSSSRGEGATDVAGGPNGCLNVKPNVVGPCFRRCATRSSASRTSGRCPAGTHQRAA
jgi:hypothetical protein